MLVEKLSGLIRKHVYIDGEPALVIVLWIIWTYLVQEDFVEKTPYLGITGADKRVGKTRLLDLIERLVYKGYGVARLSEAALYRLIEHHKPTVLIDEFHRLLAKYPNLLDLFLSGYDRGKRVSLVNKETHQLENYDCWGAKAFTYLGNLDDQLRDRLIEIYLERKPKGENRARLRETPKEDWQERQRMILRSVMDNAEAIGVLKVLPLDVVNDRATDNWELLLAIARVIDPEIAAQARAIAMAEESEKRDEDSEGPQVLKVLRKAFLAECKKRKLAFDKPESDFVAIPLRDLCSALNAEEIAPWKDRDKPVTSPWLSRIMRRYRLKAVNVRLPAQGVTSSKVAKSYRLKQLRKYFLSP